MTLTEFLDQDPAYRDRWYELLLDVMANMSRGDKEMVAISDKERVEQRYYPVIKNCLKMVKMVKEETGVNRKIISERLDISERTVSWYMKMLRDVGYPIKYSQKRQQYEMVHDNYTDLGEDLDAESN